MHNTITISTSLSRMTSPASNERLGCRIAMAVCENLKKLPAKSKPITRSNGIREWVPLSGIVLDHGTVICQ